MIHLQITFNFSSVGTKIHNNRTTINTHNIHPVACFQSVSVVADVVTLIASQCSVERMSLTFRHCISPREQVECLVDWTDRDKHTPMYVLMPAGKINRLVTYTISEFYIGGTVVVMTI